LLRTLPFHPKGQIFYSSNEREEKNEKKLVGQTGKIQIFRRKKRRGQSLFPLPHEDGEDDPFSLDLLYRGKEKLPQLTEKGKKKSRLARRVYQFDRNGRKKKARQTSFVHIYLSQKKEKINMAATGAR